MTTSVAKTVDTLVQSFQEYKTQNDARFKTINQEVSAKAAELEIYEIAQKRPQMTSQEGELNMETAEYKGAFVSYVRRGEEACQWSTKSEPHGRAKLNHLGKMKKAPERLFL